NPLVAFAVGLLTSSFGADPPKATDADELEGTWVVVSTIQNGQPLEEWQGDKLIFKEGIVVRKFKEKGEGKATYTTDPSKKPKEIDLRLFMLSRGIYALEGDRLKICLEVKPDSKRPTEFTARERSDNLLIELKREKQ